MKLPTLTQLQLHADVSHKQTYAYEFTVKGRKNRWFHNNGAHWLYTGAGYGDEIEYVFGRPWLISMFFDCLIDAWNYNMYYKLCYV